MRKWAFLLLCFLLSPSVFAEEEEKSDMNVQMSGYFLWDGGFVKEFQDKDSKTFKNEPFAGLVGGLELSARPSPNLYLMINPEIRGGSPFPVLPGILGAPSEGQQVIKWSIFMEEGKNVWTIGGTPERPLFENSLGLMVYKENPDTKVFGDYLFRSQIYPSLITTKFNYPQTQIFGLHVKNNLGNFFSHNFMITSDFQHYPFYDISMAYAADVSFAKMVEIGAAVNARSIIPVRPSRTTPEGGEGEGVIDNTYKFVPYQTDKQLIDPKTGKIRRSVTIASAGNDSAGNPLANIIITEYGDDGLPGTPTTKTVAAAKGRAGIEGFAGGVTDVVEGMGLLTDKGRSDANGIGQGRLAPELGGESIPYSFGGQIVTARAAVSPLGFMDVNPLGKDALKVYVEGAILGVKNYPLYYDKMRERIPVMFGINLPTLNYLDFLTVEAEYFPSNQIPTTWLRWQKNVPRPGVFTHGTTLAEWAKPGRLKEDDWKWAVIARRSFKAFSFVAQAGSDHLKLEDRDNMNVAEMLSRPSHWYIQARFITGFY